jgi:SAM-dependent MidA family methyltransferase
MKDNLRVNTQNPSVSEALHQSIVDQIHARGGWLPFDDFMQAALYTPGLGYYASGLQKFGASPQTGSDFVTAPELSPVFGQCLAEQAAQVLQQTGTRHIFEFGAGSGMLAQQICEHLPRLSCELERYYIIEISSELRARQQQRLQAWGDKLVWLDELPQEMRGVVLGNEVLDAMPVKLLLRRQGIWYERGVTETAGRLIWLDRPTPLRPPLEPMGAHDYLTEIHPQQEAFMRTLAPRLKQGVAIWLDYGFPESEYYHPQRHMGTVMCHALHRADPDPLQHVGLKDITAHVNFTGVALAAQEAGLEVLGYSSQGRFLLNCGMLQKTEHLDQSGRGLAARLIQEHEMGELFKVLAVGHGVDFELIGFHAGDRSHTL